MRHLHTLKRLFESEIRGYQPFPFLVPRTRFSLLTTASKAARSEEGSNCQRSQSPAARCRKRVRQNQIHGETGGWLGWVVVG